jgi:hypothetical protein
MRLYLADGEHPLQRAYQTLVVLAEDEQAALRIIAHEVQGFRIDQMQAIRDYKQLEYATSCRRADHASAPRLIA